MGGASVLTACLSLCSSRLSVGLCRSVYLSAWLTAYFWRRVLWGSCGSSGMSWTTEPGRRMKPEPPTMPTAIVARYFLPFCRCPADTRLHINQQENAESANSAKAVALPPSGDWIYSYEMPYLIITLQRRPSWLTIYRKKFVSASVKKSEKTDPTSTFGSTSKINHF